MPEALRLLSFYVGPPRGGCYERLIRLHEALAERGVLVDALVLDPPASRSEKLRYHASGDPKNALTPAGLLRSTWRAGRLARSVRADGILAFGSIYAALLLPFRRGRRTVTFLRGSWPEQERARGAGAARIAMVEAIERLALRGTRVLSVSKALVPRGHEATVIPNDAPTITRLERAEARRRLNLSPQGFIAGALGAVTPVKSLETLVRAAARSSDVHVALTGCGTGSPYESFVTRECHALRDSGRAHLLPWVDRDLFLSAIDVLVLPSRHEGSPNALLAGLSAGIPVLGARSPGIEEMLVDDRLLFPQGDAAALGARLNTLASSSAAVADVARRAADVAGRYRFDWDEVAASAVIRALRADRAAE